MPKESFLNEFSVKPVEKKGWKKKDATRREEEKDTPAARRARSSRLKKRIIDSV